MVANDWNVGDVEFLEDISLPKELVIDAKVGKIATMDNKVEIGPTVDIAHHVLGLIVPSLGVGNKSKTEGGHSLS